MELCAIQTIPHRYCDVLTLERMTPLEEGLEIIEERYITLFEPSNGRMRE